MVLDRNLALCPLNGVGELFIAVQEVTPDCMNTSTSTTGKWVENPYADEIFGTGAHNKLMYKTGELVRRLNDGTL